MCGLTGWLSTLPERFGAPQSATLGAMQAALHHRGPDGRGAHLDPPRKRRKIGVAMGFTRLAIRDINHGGQPMLGGRSHESTAHGTTAHETTAHETTAHETTAHESTAHTTERVVATVNGELYDEQLLRDALQRDGCDLRSHCDAELLAHGAAIWGDAIWPRLEGMFAAVVWRPERSALTLSRDGSGQKPLYVALVDDGRTLLWGSEMGALLAHGSLRPSLDPRGVDALLWLDYVPAPGSLLRGVYKLPAGAVWTVTADDDGLLQLRTTDIPTLAAQATDHTSWQPNTPPAGPKWRLLDAVDALDQRLSRAVQRRLVSDVPVGVFLSGGVDSSLVAHYAAQHYQADFTGDKRLQTVSIRFDEPSFDESIYAEEVASYLGTQHRQISFSSQDALRSLDSLLHSNAEPLADPSLLVTQHLCAKADLTVALGGDGGDEAWLGYPTFAVHGLANQLGRLPLSLRRAAAKAGRRLPPSARNLATTEKARRFFDGLAGPDVIRSLTWIGGLPPDRLSEIHTPADTPLNTPNGTPNDSAIATWDATVGWRSPVAMLTEVATTLGARHSHSLDAERALLMRTYLADCVLQKVDRAAMAHGVEVRAPWLDRDVLALAWALPPELLLRGGVGKSVPRALAARHLPAQVATRPKKGFGVPLADWLRGPLAARCRAELRPEAVAAVPGLRPEAVAEMVRAHMDNRADYRKTLFALMRLVAWWRRIG